MESQSGLFDDRLKELYVDIIRLLQANNRLGPLNLVKSLLHSAPRELIFLFHVVEFIQDLLS